MVTVTVTNPQTEIDNRQQYTSYLVTIISSKNNKSNNNKASTPNKTIRRRYSDFTWLYSRLQTEVPCAIVPIIPHEMALSDAKRLDPEFVERRRRDLQDFLQRVVAHPELSRAPSMTPFMLDRIGVEFQQGKLRVETEYPTTIGVDDTVGAGDSSSSTTTSSVLLTSSKTAIKGMFARVRAATTSKDSLKHTSHEADIERIDSYISRLEIHVKPLAKSAETMTRLTGELAITVADIAAPVKDWKQTYQSKTLTTDQVAASHSADSSTVNSYYSENHKTSVIDMMSAIEEFSTDFSTLLLMKHKQEEESFARALQGLQNYVKAFRLALKQRKDWQVAYTATFQQVIDKEAAISKATRTLKPPEVTGKLQDEKANLDKKSAKEKEKLEACSERLVQEFKKYQPELELALKRAFFQYATLQRSYTDRINDAWGQLLPFVQEDENENKNGDDDEQEEDTKHKESTTTSAAGYETKEGEADTAATIAVAEAIQTPPDVRPPMPSAPPPPPPPPGPVEADEEGDII